MMTSRSEAPAQAACTFQPRSGSRYHTGPRVYLVFLMFLATMGLAAGCSSRNNMVMELSGTVMYEKPRIMAVSHALTDLRDQGGPTTVQVRLTGDPGLEASFDITPGIAAGVAMVEGPAGTYSATFQMPAVTVGGPFTVLGRIRHAQAGEAVLRDPQTITIPLLLPED